MDWLQKHIAVICMAFGLLTGIFIIVSWGVGYYANALFGAKFDLASCWQGISAAGVGLVGLLKWLIDSGLNSDKNKIPFGEGDKKL